MWEGSVTALFIAAAADAPMQALTAAHLVPGRGIEGDRYYNHTGTHSVEGETSFEVTLIEQETIEAIQKEGKEKVEASAPRRNIVTEGFSLNHLVGQEFCIGAVRLRGLALREPCAHLMETNDHRLVVALIHRGGLGAQILTEGVIRPGDRILPIEQSPT